MSSSSHSRDELRLPFTLPERYRVKRHLANGGMASVWCAEDLELDRSVAIKVLAERFAHDAEALRRFKREARAAARVGTHAQVVTVYDVDITPADADGPGRAFIVMEYLAGGTVADAIRHDDIRRQEAIRWLREAASALDHAHAAGIVHRDVKPANFLLDRSRVLHVADFGIARLTSEETITSPDQLFGTAAYLSPEQALGHEATSASDRYALAVVAFELLVGERPFHSPHFSAQARQHIETPPPAASERNRMVPPAVDPVFAAGLAKDPEQRPDSADELVRALEAAFGERRPIHRQFPTRRVAGPGIGAPDALTEAARGGRGRLAPSRSIAAVAERSRPRQPAPTWTPSSPPPGGRAPRRRLGALAALLAVFVIVGVAAAAAAGVFSGSPENRTNEALAAGRSAKQARTALGHSTPATQVAANGTRTAAELQLTGHRQMLDGNYTQALQTLKQAVSTAQHSSATYASALYDLGRTELLSGNPEAAISVLRQRLAIPLQTAAVRATLSAALQAAAAPPTQTTTSAPPTSSSTTTSSTTSTTPTSPASGGAGVAAPGQGGGPGAGGNGGGGGASGDGSSGAGGRAGGGNGSTGAGNGSGAGGQGSGSGAGGGNGSAAGGGNGASGSSSGSGGSGGGGNGSGGGGSGSGGSGSGGSGSGGAGLIGQLAAAA
jgi:serine/threonine protein kinase